MTNILKNDLNPFTGLPKNSSCQLRNLLSKFQNYIQSLFWTKLQASSSKRERESGDGHLRATASELRRVVVGVFNPIQVGNFRGCSRMRGGGKKAPLPKTCHAYHTMMKLGTPYLNKIQKNI